jgi:protein O-GlcNAc transferase
VTRGYERDLGRAFAALLAARTCCDWDLCELIQASIRQAEDPPWTSQVASPFAVLLMEDTTPGDQLKVARSYAESIPRSAVRTGSRATERQNARSRMRIGYLSGDFFNHAVSNLVAGVIEAHDRSRFEIIGYDYSPIRDDEYRRRLMLGFDRMVPLCNLDDTAAAQRIAADDCDLVVDLKGWTAGTRSRMLATRSALLQVQWLGYPGTLGAPWIDYIIADRTLVRPGEEVHFSEKVVRLPDTYQPYDDRRRIGPLPSRAACGLPERALVFCSFKSRLQDHAVRVRGLDGTAPGDRRFRPVAPRARS